jgi:hypothetical protein
VGELSCNSARPAGSGVRHVGHLDVFHRLAWPGWVDDLAVASVEPHMVDVAVEEHQIASSRSALSFIRRPG